MAVETNCSLGNRVDVNITCLVYLEDGKVI